ncbi:MAG: hypothetical protein R2795_17190 [Saprospiraceae bacterium]
MINLLVENGEPMLDTNSTTASNLLACVAAGKRAAAVSKTIPEKVKGSDTRITLCEAAFLLAYWQENKWGEPHGAVSKEIFQDVLLVMEQHAAQWEDEFTGLLKYEEGGLQVFSPDGQAIWGWMLERVAALGETLQWEVVDWVNRLELLVYECNAQLWDETEACYIAKSEAWVPIALPGEARKWMPLWAGFPDQDQAEEMLVKLETSLKNEAFCADFFAHPDRVLLVIDGMRQYEMHAMADSLEARCKSIVGV